MSKHKDENFIYSLSEVQMKNKIIRRKIKYFLVFVTVCCSWYCCNTWCSAQWRWWKNSCNVRYRSGRFRHRLGERLRGGNRWLYKTNKSNGAGQKQRKNFHKKRWLSINHCRIPCKSITLYNLRSVHVYWKHRLPWACRRASNNMDHVSPNSTRSVWICGPWRLLTLATIRGLYTLTYPYYDTVCIETISLLSLIIFAVCAKNIQL